MLANELTDLIKVYDDQLDEDLCDEVIKFFNNKSQLHQRYDRDARPNFTQLNMTEYIGSGECTEDEKIMHTELTRVFMSAISLYQIDCSITDEIPSQWGLEQIRIKKYNQATDCCDSDKIDASDQFKEHVDVGDHNSARRFIALFLYLNDTAGGGKTTFPYLNLNIEPKPGRILMFPPMWMYPHLGRPCFETDKYIVGTYTHYL
mgnify:CR=1 FL=1|jgi:hypothetical protein